MNENANSCQEKEISVSKSKLLQTQEELEKLIYAGEEIMDRVCFRKSLASKEPVSKGMEGAKDMPQNLIEELKILVITNNRLVDKLNSLINRMAEVF